MLNCNVYCTSVEKFAAVNEIYARYFRRILRHGSLSTFPFGPATSISRSIASQPSSRQYRGTQRAADADPPAAGGGRSAQDVYGWALRSPIARPVPAYARRRAGPPAPSAVRQNPYGAQGCRVGQPPFAVIAARYSLVYVGAGSHRNQVASLKLQTIPFNGFPDKPFRKASTSRVPPVEPICFLKRRIAGLVAAPCL